jgi:hypothetical protein
VRPYLEKTLHKNRAGGEAQSEGPEFSPSTTKKKGRKKESGVSLHLNKIIYL